MRNFSLVSRMNGKGLLPERSTKNSGGYDMFAIEDVVLQPNEITYVPTGVKVSMENDEILILANRSSNPKKKGIVLASGINIIDADYFGNPDNEGEIILILKNITSEPVKINAGDKTVQAVFVKYLLTEDDNATTERKSGIGSTGK